MDQNYFDFDNGQNTVYDCPPLDPKATARETRRSISRTLLFFFGYLAASYVANEIVISALKMFFPELIAKYSFIAQLAQIIVQYCILLPNLFLIYKGQGSSCPPSKGKMSIGSLSLIFIICWGTMKILAEVGVGVMDGIGVVTGFDYNYILELIGDETWFSTLYGLIIAPFFEELIYRKVLIDNTRRHGEVPAIVLSALLFGLMHGNFYQFFYATALGLVLGYVYCKTGKIYITMILHGLLNFVGSTFMQLLLKLIRYDDFITLDGEGLVNYLAEHSVTNVVMYLINLANYCIMVLAVVLLILNIKKIRLNKNENGLPIGRSIAITLINTGVILCYCAYAVEFAEFLFLVPIMLQNMGQYKSALIMKLGLI